MSDLDEQFVDMAVRDLIGVQDNENSAVKAEKKSINNIQEKRENTSQEKQRDIIREIDIPSSIFEKAFSDSILNEGEKEEEDKEELLESIKQEAIVETQDVLYKLLKSIR